MNEWREIPIDLIDRNPDQPRTIFDEVSLAELAASITAHGVIQPVEVEETGDGRFRLHHGERRWRAARMAGLAEIPAVVAGRRDDEALLVRGLIENLHREDLNPIDEARVFKALLDIGWTRTRIARETGRAQMIVAGRLAWLDLEPEIQQLVALGQLPRDGRLAQEFRKVAPEVRMPLARKMATHTLSLKACLKAVERAATIPARPAAAPSPAQGNGHATPMLRFGVARTIADGNGSAAGRSVYEAAEAMCRACHWRPKGDAIPAWEMVEAAAAETCAACVKRDGPALPDVCRNCPGVAMVKALTR